MNMRGEFEKWLSSCLGSFVDMSRDDYGVYQLQDVRLAWMAWQAAQPKWIKCSEQMPPLGELVLVVASVPGTMLRNLYEWDGNVWRDFAGRLNPLGRDLVSHWMPLPNPPEE